MRGADVQVEIRAGDLSDLIWTVNETIEQLSAAMTLQPGDLIFTGTPAGVGPVVPGDSIELSLPGLSTLRVTITGAA